MNTRHLSLISATASLFGLAQFPDFLPRRNEQAADFNDFGAVFSTVLVIFPVTREFAPLAFAAARRP